MLAFMFRHGHYAEACSLSFPSNEPTVEGETSLSSIRRSDPLTTDYGTIDDLCDLCLGYGAMSVLEDTIFAVIQSPTYHDTAVIQYMNAVLTRICNYCETHRHFNYLYSFLVLSSIFPLYHSLWSPFLCQLKFTMKHGVQALKGDHVASGLCCIQLFVNSMSQDESLKHLGHAKVYMISLLICYNAIVGLYAAPSDTVSLTI